VNDTSSCCHPLYVTTDECPFVPSAVVMMKVAVEQITNRLEPTMRMVRGANSFPRAIDDGTHMIEE
jgi:hypothetical protein